MASVVLAEDLVLQRNVALKRLAGSALLGGGRERSLSRLRREALLGASVAHPNLVSIYDVIATPDQELVIVMEYVEGETLSDRLNRDRQLTPDQALPVLDGVAAALHAIHARGIVHRDVKPANVLLGQRGEVKLADLGIASVSDLTRITSAGAVMGTYRYMAPEQLEDMPMTPAIDVYALGAVAFEVLAGRPARQEPNPVAIAHAITNRPPPDLTEAWPAAPPAAAQLLARAMAKDPAERPPSALALVGELRRTLEEQVRPVGRPVTPREPVQRRDPPPPFVAAEPPHPPPAPRIAPPLPTRGQARAQDDAFHALPLSDRPIAPRRRGAVWLAGLLLAGAVAVVAALATSGGGSTPTRSTTPSAAGRTSTVKSTSAVAAGTPATTQTATQAARPSTPAASGTVASSSASPPATAGAGSPVAAVESFYHLAAAHDYSAAWRLADPTFQAQLGGYASFASGQAEDRSITFDQAALTSRSASSATVSVATTSVRTNGTQHCSGTVDLVEAGASWLLHQIHITCS
jgi:hypothetical protein